LLAGADGGDSPGLGRLAKAPVAAARNSPASSTRLVADETERPPLLTSKRSKESAGPDPGELRLEDARKLARDNPAAVANIVKTWMGSEAPA
jgi:flagellar M-ring protein FliF